jgi:hypothetical protein
MRAVIIVLICTFTLSFAVPAHAGRSSMIAASCVPGDPAIQANRYFVTAGSVKHKEGATGLITLYCPIQPTIVQGGGSFGGIFMTYTDANGPGPSANVTAQLLRVDQSGNFSPVLSEQTGVPALLDSNKGTATDHYMEAAVNHTYDFNNYYYYIRVDINRTDDTAVILYGVGADSLSDASRFPKETR